MRPGLKPPLNGRRVFELRGLSRGCKRCSWRTARSESRYLEFVAKKSRYGWFSLLSAGFHCYLAGLSTSAKSHVGCFVIRWELCSLGSMRALLLAEPADYSCELSEAFDLKGWKAP